MIKIQNLKKRINQKAQTQGQLVQMTKTTQNLTRKDEVKYRVILLKLMLLKNHLDDRLIEDREVRQGGKGRKGEPQRAGESKNRKDQRDNFKKGLHRRIYL